MAGIQKLKWGFTVCQTKLYQEMPPAPAGAAKNIKRVV